MDKEEKPSWEKWRNEQVQTISSILSTVFKVEDEVNQMQAPSRLLRIRGTEEEALEKLNAIRQQISEYEQVLQLSRKRIDKALQVIQMPTAPPETSKEVKKNVPLSRLKKIKKWIRILLGPIR